MCAVCNLFGYGEIKPPNSYQGSASMKEKFERIKAGNFQTVMIREKQDIWTGFRSLLDRERQPGAAAPSAAAAEA